MICFSWYNWCVLLRIHSNFILMASSILASSFYCSIIKELNSNFLTLWCIFQQAGSFNGLYNCRPCCVVRWQDFIPPKRLHHYPFSIYSIITIFPSSFHLSCLVFRYTSSSTDKCYSFISSPDSLPDLVTVSQLPFSHLSVLLSVLCPL